MLSLYALIFFHFFFYRYIDTNLYSITKNQFHYEKNIRFVKKCRFAALNKNCVCLHFVTHYSFKSKRVNRIFKRQQVFIQQAILHKTDIELQRIYLIN